MKKYFFHYTLQKRSTFLLSGDLFFAFNEKLCVEHGKKFRNFHFQCCMHCNCIESQILFFSLVEQIDIVTLNQDDSINTREEVNFFWKWKSNFKQLRLTWIFLKFVQNGVKFRNKKVWLGGFVPKLCKN